MLIAWLLLGRAGEITEPIKQRSVDYKQKLKHAASQCGQACRSSAGHRPSAYIVLGSFGRFLVG
jgi:hypothetical protein